MEGKSIPKIAPEQIFYVGKEKWKIIVYENSPRMGTEMQIMMPHFSRPKRLDVFLYLILI